jgi:peptidyl-prolyl cis-trans isomerase B (cyclophilin B)
VIAMLLTLLLSSFAAITSPYTYHGVNRPLMVDIENADGLRWMTADGTVAQEVAVEAGRIDLAETFDGLWDIRQVTYAQPTLGGEPIGSALVLQPLLSVSRARFDQAQAKVVFQQRGPVVMSGFRVYPERLAVLETSMGDITMRFRPDQAPNTVWNFLSLAEGGFYRDIEMHRIIKEFVIQAGDPTGVGNGGPGYNFDLEDSKLLHDFGVLSMARTNDPDTNGSQFFICLSRDRTYYLDGNYTAFGEMYDGADVIRAIGSVETAAGDRPAEKVTLERVDLVPAPPREVKPIEEATEAATETPDEGVER